MKSHLITSLLIFARVGHHLMVLFSSADFIRVIFFTLNLSFSFYILTFFFSFPFMNERIFSRTFELFVFSHSRLFPVHIPRIFSLSLSLLPHILPFHSFFNLFPFPFSFFLTPLLPSCTALGDFSFLFFFRAAESSFSFISVVFIFPSRSTLTPLFVHSASFAPCRVAFFIVFVSRCPPCSRVARPRLPIPLQVFHARKRAFSYFSQLSFSRVRPTIVRERSRDLPLRDIFRFPFRYVRLVSNTWSVLPCLDIVLFYFAKCILWASPIFAPFFLSYRVPFYSTRFSSRFSSNS